MQVANISRDAVRSTRIIEWVDGIPTVSSKNILSPSAVSDITAAALLQPYEDDLGLEPEYAGMTNLEVAVRKVATHAAKSGSISSLETLLDRWVGKPKQNVESKKLTMSYKDFLEAQAEKFKDGRELKSAGGDIGL